MRQLLVVEDGQEYSEFARLFLSDAFDVRTASSAHEAMQMAAATDFDAFLFDLRFDRTPASTLVGDVEEIASRLFGGDLERALRYVQDQQGTLILGELRAAGYYQPAVFIHDFRERRLLNLRKLYGHVSAVASFSAAEIRAALGVT